MGKSYRDILKEIYELRKQRNPTYTITAFSSDAGFKSYHISDIFHGRYGLSPRRAVNVADKLEMSPELRKEFLAKVAAESSKSPHDKKKAQDQLDSMKFDADKLMSVDDFSPLSSWYYLAIVELARKKNFRNDAAWISERLSITQDEAAQAIHILTEQKIINFCEGAYSVDFELLAIRNQQASSVIRGFHRSMISKSLNSMEAHPVTERTFNSFNVLLSPEDYANLTVELSAFIRKKIVTYQKHTTDSSRLYTINSQVFPLEESGKAQ